MKKYKVGDTIYAKGKIIQVDKYDTSLPYCVDFENGAVWMTSDAIIDELPTAEPVKPVLPKEVADEISFAKSITGVTFDEYIVRELIRSDYKDSATNKMIQSPDVPNAIEMLLNAWRYGYTVAKEKSYVLPMPGTDYHNNLMHGNVKYYAVKGSGVNWRPDVIALDTDDAVKHGYTVTQSDIDAAPGWVKAITPVEVNDYED